MEIVIYVQKKDSSDLFRFVDVVTKGLQTVAVCVNKYTREFVEIPLDELIVISNI